ncbi:AAEL000252-PA [Aedes aegypti]|uniref:AAEL000252-PA n=2 Tax=Aedes aegypti TaxID=7159 RepID=A0A1S4EVB0_AEDAE|nr:serine protease snake [Aedes aegypti]EAT48740.1 AAEL000252-PA [Aedes aegypti]
MRLTISSLLLVFVLVAWVQAGSNQRIAQAKCQDYHHRAKSNELDNCLRGEYPHIAFIGWKTENDPDIGWKMENDHDDYNFLGFGNLISEHYILTTARSTSFQQKKPDIVRLGAMDLDYWKNPDATDYEVSEVITHPNYNERLAYNDIGLVRLDEPVSFSESIRPVCLWDSLQMNFTSLVTTGFGRGE